MPSKPIKWFDPENPLAPVKGETAKANDALREYVDLGPMRTTREVARLFGYRSARLVERWCAQYRWVDRVRAWVQVQGRLTDAKLAEYRAMEGAKAIEQLKHIAAEAVIAWEKSKRERKRTRTRAAMDKSGKTKGRAERSVETIETVGDPRLLVAAIKANDALRRALGLDAASKVELDLGEGARGTVSDIGVALSEAAKSHGGADLLRSLQSQLKGGIEKK